jgi:hypothetical protein
VLLQQQQLVLRSSWVRLQQESMARMQESSTPACSTTVSWCSKGGTIPGTHVTALRIGACHVMIYPLV